MTHPSATARLGLSEQIKQAARRAGFAQVGICAAVRPGGIERFAEWLAAGYAGEMNYLSRRAAAYEHPSHVLDGVRSLVMLALPYQASAPQVAGQGRGRVSRYAWGTDYHDLIRQRVERVANEIAPVTPDARWRCVVDTAPLLEREFAQLAGLGWIGKNTLLLNRGLGSYFFLAALLTDLELEYDEPWASDYCGTCRACLDACPTGAFVAPYVLDARRCISYLTIELRGPVPSDLRPGMGDWVFGCDVCQEVCPWNQHAPLSIDSNLAPRADLDPLDLTELFSQDEQAFRQRFRGSPIWRAKRRGLLRNAAVVLGNQKLGSAIGALTLGLDDPEALVRGACAWALGRIGGDAAQAVLERRCETEPDSVVLAELRAALAEALMD
ncbi:MAG: tRNA epoxyqueuosine(34) reductase QueG [Pirellulales bacterium]|nr:tRNA epoxyqueuosine(34) reductase QueG [Pirellulales bacterium]